MSAIINYYLDQMEEREIVIELPINSHFRKNVTAESGNEKGFQKAIIDRIASDFRENILMGFRDRIDIEDVDYEVIESTLN